MILLWSVAASLVIALLRGGKLVNLGTLRFRVGWLAFVALLLQVLVVYLPFGNTGTEWSTQSLLLVGSYALLIGVVVANRELPGLWILGVGLALNLAVMIANGGFMPVAEETLRRAGLLHLATSTESGARLLSSKDILLPREETRLWFLGDVFSLPAPLSTAYSIGDILLAIGAFILFQRGTMPRQAGCALGKTAEDSDSSEQIM